MANVGENLRKWRKQKELTQEQLAERLGVSVGVISKWELGQSEPEASVLIKMAGCFEISVDCLLGYCVESKSKSELMEQMEKAIEKKEYEECVKAVDMLLTRYPNVFDVVYACGKNLFFVGMETKKKEILKRAVRQMERAKQLIGQNQDESISELLIEIEIAQAYLMTGEREKGVERLKKNNPCGINDDLIGFAYAAEGWKCEQAKRYLSNALLEHICGLVRVVCGYVNVFYAQKEYDLYVEILQWAIQINNGLKREGKPNFLEKTNALLYAVMAGGYAAKGEWEQAECVLKQAREQAEKFDSQPDYCSKNIKYCDEETKGTAHDDMGSSAVEGIERILGEDLWEQGDRLWKLWKEWDK